MPRRSRLLALVVMLVASGAGTYGAPTASAATVEVLSEAELNREMRYNRDLRVHVEHSGYPDLAQRWQVYSELPWAGYLVRLIYLDAAQELGFSRSYLLGQMQYGSLRYRRPLSEELAEQTRQFLATAAPMPVAGLEEPADAATAAERAERAAERAERAAETSARGAETVEATAQRLEELAARAEASTRKPAPKK
jgi:hypothetical protein